MLLNEFSDYIFIKNIFNIFLIENNLHKFLLKKTNLILILKYLNSYIKFFDLNYINLIIVEILYFDDCILNFMKIFYYYYLKDMNTN